MTHAWHLNGHPCRVDQLHDSWPSVRFKAWFMFFFLKFNLAPVELIRLISELQSCAFLVF